MTDEVEFSEVGKAVARITKVLNVRNAAPLRSTATISLLPDTLKIVYVYGKQEEPEIVVSGPRILVGGGYGQRVTKKYWSRNVRDGDLPDWVRTAILTFAPPWEEIIRWS